MEEALRLSRSKKIGVIATQATIASGAHEAALRELDRSAECCPMACPKFVPLIEAGHLDDAPMHDAVREYTEPLKAAGVDVLILGCTHYPYAAPALRTVLGDAVNLIDPATATARKAKEVLLEEDALNPQERGKLTLCFTAQLEKNKRAAEYALDTTAAEFVLADLTPYAAFAKEQVK